MAEAESLPVESLDLGEAALQQSLLGKAWILMKDDNLAKRDDRWCEVVDD